MSFYHNPRIVTSGLDTFLDIKNPKSYVTGSFIINDLTGNGISASIFDIEYDGNKKVVMTRSGSYVSVKHDAITTNKSYFTITVGGYNDMRFYKRGDSNKGYAGVSTTNSNILALFGVANYTDTHNLGLTIDEDTPYILTYVSDNDEVRMYVNDISTYTTASSTSRNTTTQPIIFGQEINSDGTLRGPVSCSFQFFIHYSRALNDDEVQKNYVALRGRFGI